MGCLAVASVTRNPKNSDIPLSALPCATAFLDSSSGLVVDDDLARDINRNLSFAVSAVFSL